MFSDQVITSKIMASTSNLLENFDEIDDGDRLSELPDEILVHILSFLPILDAVRTVLIRRFGYLWTSIYSLCFDDTELFSQEWPCGLIEYQEYISSFASFVRNALILHRRIPIDKFQLRFHDIDVNNDGFKSFENEITTWISFAINREVKELKVQFEYHVDASILPPCVFTSQFLVELELIGHDIKQLSQVQMGSLRKLSLVGLGTNNEVVKKLISGSPSLHELAILNVHGLDELRFTAPNIEKLDLYYYRGLLDCPNLKILNIVPYFLYRRELIQMVDISSVFEVNILGVCCLLDTFVNFVKVFCNVHVFKFSFEDLQSSTLKDLDFPQTRWKKLHIMSKLHFEQHLSICKVLNSSPHLEELIIYTLEHDLGITDDYNMVCPELPSCLTQLLKTVTMLGYRVHCRGLLQLAEFLLKSCVALEKMVILPDKNQVYGPEEFMLVKQVLSFPRVSPNAVVFFGSETH